MMKELKNCLIVMLFTFNACFALSGYYLFRCFVYNFFINGYVQFATIFATAFIVIMEYLMVAIFVMKTIDK